LAAAAVAACLPVRRGGAVGTVGLLAASLVAARLSLRGGVRLGRSVCWRLPQLSRVCACATGCS